MTMQDSISFLKFPGSYGSYLKEASHVSPNLLQLLGQAFYTGNSSVNTSQYGSNYSFT